MPRKRPSVPRRPMSTEEGEMARALARCSFLPATAAKRFAREMGWRAEDDNPEISEREAAYLRGLVYTYRRQIPKDTVSLAGDVPKQRRDFASQQAWRNAEVATQEGAHALMTEGYRTPVAFASPPETLDLFPSPRVVDDPSVSHPEHPL